MTTHTHYHDDRHGWIRTTMRDLIGTGTAHHISRHSYRSDGYAYLEEDSDAALYVSAYTLLKGAPPAARSEYHRGESRIRRYARLTLTAAERERSTAAWERHASTAEGWSELERAVTIREQWRQRLEAEGRRY